MAGEASDGVGKTDWYRPVNRKKWDKAWDDYEKAKKHGRKDKTVSS